MTLAELKAIAESDSASTDPRRRKAGEWAKKAVERMAAKDWNGATVALAHAITGEPGTYAEAFLVISGSHGGVNNKGVSTPKKAASSRENGKKGGRPRKYPEGWRAVPRPLTRKPGETRGRKPKRERTEGGAE